MDRTVVAHVVSSLLRDIVHLGLGRFSESSDQADMSVQKICRSSLSEAAVQWLHDHRVSLLLFPSHRPSPTAPHPSAVTPMHALPALEDDAQRRNLFLVQSLTKNSENWTNACCPSLHRLCLHMFQRTQHQIQRALQWYRLQRNHAGNCLLSLRAAAQNDYRCLRKNHLPRSAMRGWWTLTSVRQW